MKRIALATAFCAAAIFMTTVEPQTSVAAVIPMTTQDLVAGADVCVYGHVTDVSTAWGGDNLIYTTYTIQVSEALMGTPGSTIAVRVEGGDLDGIKMRNGEAPVIALGEDIVCFGKQHGAEYVTWGWFQGKYTVIAGMVRERSNESYETFRNSILAAVATK